MGLFVVKKGVLKKYGIHGELPCFPSKRPITFDQEKFGLWCNTPFLLSLKSSITWYRSFFILKTLQNHYLETQKMANFCYLPNNIMETWLILESTYNNLWVSIKKILRDVSWKSFSSRFFWPPSAWPVVKPSMNY